MRYVTTALLLVCLVSGVRAQEQRGTSPQNAIPGNEMASLYYKPQHTTAPRLLDAAQQVHGRNLFVNEHKIVRNVRNLHAVGQAILIYDVKEAVESVKAALEAMDLAHRGSASTTELHAWEYTPKHLSLADVQIALKSYHRNIQVSADQYSVNISFLQGRGSITVRDTPAQIAEIQSLLERIDVPQRQAVITIHLLKPADGDEVSNLPANLARNLSKLTAYERFTIFATASIRTAARTRKPVQLSMDVGESSECMFSLQPGGFDQKNDKLNLESVRFDLTTHNVKGAATRRSFTTSTSIDVGEFVVLGGVGADPTYVVLQLTVQ